MSELKLEDRFWVFGEVVRQGRRTGRIIGINGIEMPLVEEDTAILKGRPGVVMRISVTVTIDCLEEKGVKTNTFDARARKLKAGNVGDCTSDPPVEIRQVPG